MNHIAHIEGLQDNILSNLSDSHLLKIRTFSNHWIKPSHTVINTRLESYIQKFKKLVGYIPTSPHDDLDATPKNQTGYAWHRARWSYSRVVLGAPIALGAGATKEELVRARTDISCWFRGETQENQFWICKKRTLIVPQPNCCGGECVRVWICNFIFVGEKWEYWVWIS